MCSLRDGIACRGDGHPRTATSYSKAIETGVMTSCVPVERPLGHIAGHVTDPVRAGEFREGAHRRRVFESVVGSVEKILIQEALKRTGGNQVQAAQLLGMHRSTLRKKRKDFDI